MSKISPEMQQKIQALAQKGVQAAQTRFGERLDYSLKSLDALERLLQGAAKTFTERPPEPGAANLTVQIWGAYLGETFRRSRGAEWESVPGETGERQLALLAGDKILYPFEQVRKRLGLNASDAAAALVASPLQPPTQAAPRQVVQSIVAQTRPPAPEGTAEAIGTLADFPPKTPTAKPAAWLPYGCGAFAFLVVLGVVLSLLIPTLLRVNGAYRSAQRVMIEAFVEAELPAYTRSYRKAPADYPLLQGKMVVIDPETGALNDMYWNLPKELQAQSPDEVSVVVLAHCYAIEEGYYQGTTILNSREACDMKVVDLTEQLTVGEQQFLGEPMTEEIHVAIDGTIPIEDLGGDLDESVVLDWILAYWGR